jgi:hypothetical protein
MPAFPDEMMGEDASWDEPPPVRRPPSLDSVGTGFLTPADLEMLGGVEETPSETAAPSVAARRALIIIGSMILIGGLIVAAVTVQVLNVVVKRESNDYANAKGRYADGKFAMAAESYGALIRDYPESQDLELYRFMQEMSELRGVVEAARGDPHEAVTQLERFLDEYQANALLREYRMDMRKTLNLLAGFAAQYAAEHADGPMLKAARKSLELSHRYTSEDDPPEAEVEIRDQIAAAEKAVTRLEQRQHLLAEIQGDLKSKPSRDRLKSLHEAAKEKGLLEDVQVKAALARLETAVREQVRYVDERAESTEGSKPPSEPSLVFTPALVPANASAKSSGRVVLALARGVLYALDEANGETRWVMRVGVDTTQLPVRLERTTATSELFLVLSADRKLLMAVTPANGAINWQHTLSAPCLGRPLVVGRRAFVPTYVGKVHEIEVISGNVLGHFELGQPLTLGGVRQEGTDLLYFAGESDNIYVLDAAKHVCVKILHTGHPAGSLRSEPIIINRSDPFARETTGSMAWPSYLVLSQSDGLDRMKLRVFALPIENPDAPPLMQPEPGVRGWSWFRPYFDDEKLAFVTDAGVLGLFGLNQVRNDDRPIFSSLHEEYRLGDAVKGLVRAQVVNAVENDLWIIANSEMQRFSVDLYNQRLLPLWAKPVRLGAPIHAGQADETGKTIFLVTQDQSRQVYLATAVDANDGSVRWQRMLGLDPHGDLLHFGNQTAALDKSGALFLFGANKRQLATGRGEWWLTDSNFTPPLGSGVDTLVTVPAVDGSAVYEFATADKPTHLTIRIYDGGAVTDATIDLPAALAGTPAASSDCLLLPLADGTIQRLALPLDGTIGTGGPNWRAARTDDGARGYVVSVNADEFLTTDGSGGLTHWQWHFQQKETFQALPEGRQPTATLPARIISCPVVLRTARKNELSVLVADAAGSLWLLRGPDLAIGPSWNLHGRITAGPFVRGDRIGCVVDRRRLVWIDPSKDKQLWEHPVQGEAIVGQPEVVGNMVVVADLEGGFTGLDPATGQPLGKTYKLQTNAAAAATPTALGADEACVPLTDGTVFLLKLSLLRAK